jgi:hypothetical protein
MKLLVMKSTENITPILKVEIIPNKRINSFALLTGSVTRWLRSFHANYSQQLTAHYAGVGMTPLVNKNRA